jgi:hypothetical protein
MKIDDPVSQPHRNGNNGASSTALHINLSVTLIELHSARLQSRGHHVSSPLQLVRYELQDLLSRFPNICEILGYRLPDWTVMRRGGYTSINDGLLAFLDVSGIPFRSRLVSLGR